MNDFFQQLYSAPVTTADILSWLGVILAVVVSLLTLYNAARLRSGVLAVSSYAFGAGMLFLTAALFVSSLPTGADTATVSFLYRLLIVLGFIFLGFGSYKIYQMSRI